MAPLAAVCQPALAPRERIMKILVDRVKGTPTELRFEADDPGWNETLEVVPELRAGLGKLPTATVRVHRIGSDLYLEGMLEGAFELECSRCLARYGHPLREPFRLVLEPAGARVPPEPEAARELARLGMCMGDELEMGWFQGQEIDLRGFLREVAALGVPVQPLCREDCRGLCPRCGADRNVVACECEPAQGADEAVRGERPASPFAALAALRRPEGEGEG
jgi:uncharacterized protein